MHKNNSLFLARHYRLGLESDNRIYLQTKRPARDKSDASLVFLVVNDILPNESNVCADLNEGIGFVVVEL